MSQPIEKRNGTPIKFLKKFKWTCRYKRYSTSKQMENTAREMWCWLSLRMYVAWGVLESHPRIHFNILNFVLLFLCLFLALSILSLSTFIIPVFISPLPLSFLR